MTAVTNRSLKWTKLQFQTMERDSNGSTEASAYGNKGAVQLRLKPHVLLVKRDESSPRRAEGLNCNTRYGIESRTKFYVGYNILLAPCIRSHHMHMPSVLKTPNGPDR